ncbi:MAG: hypothetical protein ACI9Y1_002428 [Lentisphaeria bacterium]|jgi:hypothetical protein
MKRPHRIIHRWLWLCLFPGLALVCFFAYQHRGDNVMPVNNSLPEFENQKVLDAATRESINGENLL